MEESFGSVWQVTHRGRRRPKKILDVSLCLLGILTNCTSFSTTPTPTPQRSSLPQNPLTTRRPGTGTASRGCRHQAPPPNAPLRLLSQCPGGGE